ncbi:GH92 family glycosyl hydrolase [Persicobacter psychrovividus]|uniref:Alpha-1 2-mannosidase n=1 Tax=Persicobacter psychrovividus TaxID=387638 RepID=A0ABN6LG01_9BACT|nr:alpha-1 2-mannosidase [Persicobacter psychrovividus]
MRGIYSYFLSLAFLFIGGCQIQNQGGKVASVSDRQPVDWVNPYIGNISHLLVPTFPTIHLPNSFLRVIPERADFTSDRLSGLPVITTSHRGASAFTLSPSNYSAQQQIAEVGRLSYDQEKITPYGYQVYLDEMKVAVNYSLSHQSGIYQLSFEEGQTPALTVHNKKGQLKIADGAISGYQVVDNEVTENTTKVYLYLKSEQNALRDGVIQKGKLIASQKEIQTDKGSIAMVFGADQQQITVRYGVSLISVEQAKRNLEREQNGKSFDEIATQGRKIWNDALGKIEVSGASEDDRTIFYTSVYRTYERPVCISEDGQYFSAFDGEIHQDNGQPFYTDDWIWDTYRATHPLRVLTEKQLETNILNSFIRMAEQMPNAWMPTFPEVMGDSRRMNSNHGVATVLDAAVKGLDGFDLQKAYSMCKKGITEKTLAPWSGKPAGDLDAFFWKNGYFPALRHGQKEYSDLVHPFESRQPVAVTLGTTYDEWCLSEIARLLNIEEDHQYFLNRSYDYRKIYNASTGFFHPKDDQHQFIEPFDYRFSGGQGLRNYYGENNGWVYRWDVPHNVADLMELMGGRAAFINNLEATFNEPLGKSKFAFYAQIPDHTGNVGQFSMANEPSLHIPYLYNYAGQPWKTQKRVKTLMRQWFRNDLMGIPGDEDGGGMSAFIIFSQLGFYPVTPGMPAYNIGTPFFKESKVHLGNGKTFTIKANNLSEDNKYIQSATLNGEAWNKPWFPHSAIEHGGTLELTMGNRANLNWGAQPQDAPPSAMKMIKG